MTLIIILRDEKWVFILHIKSIRIIETDVSFS